MGDRCCLNPRTRSGAGALLALSTYVTGASIAILAAMFVIAPGYTVPPLKFVYRGLGELDVGVTHSFGVLLCGYIFQGRKLDERISLDNKRALVFQHSARDYSVEYPRLRR